MIVVNSSTRQFNIPGADLVFGVTDDSSSEVKHFQCPRYVGNNVDIASSFVRINYRNANGEVDFFLVEDVAVDGDNVTFSWELKPKVTRYKGNVSFVMCVVGPDTKVKWHTTLGRGQVLEGLEPDNEVVDGETQDGIAALIAMVDAQTSAVEAEGANQVAVVKAAAKTAESDAVAQIEAKGASTLATIPGDYTATVNAVQSAANAIRKKVSGEVIRVDDVSPMEHYPVVKMKGKNLFNIGALEVMPESYTTRVSAVDIENNTFTITTADTHTDNGYCGLTNAEGNYVTTLRDLCPQMEAGKTYVLSGTTDTATKTLYLRGVNKSWIFGKALLITEECLKAKVAMYGLNSAGGEGTGDCVISNLQIEEGDTATEYTPYIDPTTVTVTRCGKNLTAYTGETKTDTSSGISIVRTNNSAEFLVNGTATAMTSMVATSTVILPPGTYAVSVEGLNSISTDTDRCYLWNQPAGKVVANGVMTGKPKTFTISEWTPVRVEFVIGAESSYSNKTVKIQIEQGENTTNYEPYTGETQIPASDGTVSGLSAVSPTMTLLTDKTGVNIECEYSRDINVVIAEILEKITALGG